MVREVQMPLAWNEREVMKITREIVAAPIDEVWRAYSTPEDTHAVERSFGYDWHTTASTSTCDPAVSSPRVLKPRTGAPASTSLAPTFTSWTRELITLTRWKTARRASSSLRLMTAPTQVTFDSGTPTRKTCNAKVGRPFWTLRPPPRGP